VVKVDYMLEKSFTHRQKEVSRSVRRPNDIRVSRERIFESMRRRLLSNRSHGRMGREFQLDEQKEFIKRIAYSTFNHN